MQDINSKQCALIVNAEHQFRIWPTDRSLLPGWHPTGHTGTHVQMQELLERQFQTTRAATYLRAETRFSDPLF